MATTVTVLYENVADLRFDLDYYLATHMPLVDEKFTPYGMTGWKVLKAAEPATGDASRFSIIATLDFDTPQQFHDAVAAEGGPVFGDVPNFSNKSPLVVIGDVIGERR